MEYMHKAYVVRVGLLNVRMDASLSFFGAKTPVKKIISTSPSCNAESRTVYT